MALTDTSCKNAKPTEKQYRLADSKGLCLLVKPNGGKYWRLRYRFGGKEKDLSFGVYPEVTLKEARDKTDAARKLLRDDIDPSQARQEDKRQILIETVNSFEAIAREWHENQKPSWTERHANYVLRRLEADVFTAIGHRPIVDINAPELLAVMRAIEKRGAIDMLSEQKNIAEILRGIDNQITAETNKLTTLQTIKKGMMHDLLTGRVRVPKENNRVIAIT